MNERVKQLAEQAGFIPGIMGLNRFTYFDTEMFAELIVQDVLNLFGDERLSLHYLEQPCCEDAVYLLQSKIKEHFGVEE